MAAAEWSLRVVGMEGSVPRLLCLVLCLGGSHDTPGRNRPLRLKYIWAALGLDALWHTTHLDEHSAYNAVSVAVEKIVQFASTLRLCAS